MEVARGEMVEAELDAMIRRRYAQRVREEDRIQEELYMPSVRAYEDRRRRERLWEQLRFHQGQARRLSVTVAALVARHEAEAERCAEMLGIATVSGDPPNAA